VNHWRVGHGRWVGRVEHGKKEAGKREDQAESHLGQVESEGEVEEQDQKQG